MRTKKIRSKIHEIDYSGRPGDLAKNGTMTTRVMSVFTPPPRVTKNAEFEAQKGGTLRTHSEIKGGENTRGLTSDMTLVVQRQVVQMFEIASRNLLDLRQNKREPALQKGSAQRDPAVLIPSAARQKFL